MSGEDCRSRSPSAPRPRAAFGALAGVVLLGVALTAASPAEVRADAALDAYNSAVGLQKEKRWDLAAEAFRKFLKENPQHEKAPLAEFALGLTLINQDKYADARVVLRGFIKTYPLNKNMPDALYRVGECGYLLNDNAVAETDFTAFITQFPKHELMEWALPYLGDSQLRLAKYDAAAKSFETAISQFPKGRLLDEARFGLARSYDGLKRDADALAVYTQIAADKSSPRAPQAQMQIGNRLYETSKFAEAATAFGKLEQSFPQHALVPAARMNAGFAHYQLNQYPEAVARFEQAAADPKQKLAADYWIGASRQAQGKSAEAAAKFQAVLAADPMGEFGEKALFQWAELELRDGKFDAARDRSLDLVKRFPKSEFVPESLHVATEAALRTGKADEAQALLDRFAKEFPNHRLQDQQELLAGRVLDARGDAESRKKAVARYEAVLAGGKSASAKNLARLYLARTYQKTGDHAKTLEVLGPLVESSLKPDAAQPSADALVLAANSHLAQKESAKVIELAAALVERPAFLPVRDQALALRATARARSGQFAEAVADLERLEKDHPASPSFPQTVVDVAEAAYQAKDYAVSAGVFLRAARRDATFPHHAAAQSGLAWSEYEAGKHVESAARFAELLKAHPEDAARASEAAFMQGLCFQRAAQLDKAAAAYAAAWERLAPKEPVAAGAEAEGQKHHYTFRAGWKAGQVHGRLKQVPQADRHYEAVARLFPQAKERDRVLDDWALLHYEAEDFAKADELFRKLVKEYPASDRADDARLNLAESDYISRKTEAARKEFAALVDASGADDNVRRRSLYNLTKIDAELRDWKTTLASATKYLSRTDAAADADRFHVEALAAEAQLNLGDAKAAREAFQRLVDKKAVVGKDAWFAQVRVLLAEALFQLKEYDQVAAMVDDFRKDDPKSPALHRAEEVLGRALKNQAKFDQARVHFGRVVADQAAFRTETAAKCQFLIGETYLLQKDYRNAQIEYFKVEQLYKFPEWQSYALYQVAKCDEALSQWKEAVRAYEDILRKYPEAPAAQKAKVDLQAARKKLAGG